MNSLADRLSAVSALRPAGRVLKPGLLQSDRLLRELGGEMRVNSLGRHMVVQRFYPQPSAGELRIQALRFLAPGATDLIADPGRWLFLDAETTGLAGGTGTYAFLVGLAWWEEGRFAVEQYFMSDHGEEPSLLLGLLDHLARRPVLVTFNGKSFDWPLLQTRFQITRVGKVRQPPVHLDLLYPARQLWRLRLKSVALTQLESHVLGLNRGQDIPSEAIPQSYFDFLRGGPPEAMTEVFRHNRLDLCGLAFLALRICRILADPENSDCCPEELFGVSRLLQSRGEEHLAERTYRKALGGGLPESARQIAQKELAFLAKRRRDYAASNAFWEELAGSTELGLAAYEQLAVYYEHYARLPGKAAVLAREALVKLQEAFHGRRINPPKYMQLHAKFRHRLARLNARIAAQGGSHPTGRVHPESDPSPE